jgi:SAM-dependent methyltransferase
MRTLGQPPGVPDVTVGEDEAKYNSHNVVVRWLIARLMRELRGAAGSTDGIWVDVGIGEGFALEALQARAGLLVGVEYRGDKLRKALERVPRSSGVRADARLLPLMDRSADIVTCLEVLEHLETPERAIEELARVCRGECIVSVPWEPFFRLGNFCRGKDLGRWGNNPEHVQHFRPASLHRLLSRSFADVTVHPCLPWLIGVARTA